MNTHTHTHRSQPSDPNGIQIYKIIGNWFFHTDISNAPATATHCIQMIFSKFQFRLFCTLWCCLMAREILPNRETISVVYRSVMLDLTRSLVFFFFCLIRFGNIISLLPWILLFFSCLLIKSLQSLENLTGGVQIIVKVVWLLLMPVYDILSNNEASNELSVSLVHVISQNL